MFWWILLGFCGLLTITGIILWVLEEKFDYDFNLAGMFLTSIFGCLTIIIGACCIGFIANSTEEIAAFREQKYYIENIDVELSEDDEYAISIKKAELNQWLYKAQSLEKNYSFFSLYPDEILELKEIK